jgi:hypothetical protein
MEVALVAALFGLTVIPFLFRVFADSIIDFFGKGSGEGEGSDQARRTEQGVAIGPSWYLSHTTQHYI